MFGDILAKNVYQGHTFTPLKTFVPFYFVKFFKDLQITNYFELHTIVSEC